MMKIKYSLKEDYYDTKHSAGMPDRGQIDYRTMEEEKGESPNEDPDMDGDGVYSPAELEYHFDLNQDGKVTPDEYKAHVKWHARHPEVFEIDENTLDEEKPCWSGYEQIGMKKKNGKKVPNCVPVSEAFATTEDGSAVCEACLYETILENKNVLLEAEYHGHSVQLNKPTKGDVKKFKVFVRDPKTGNVKKVNFGDPNMRIKKSNPKRRKSFRARHHCENPGPKTKARYWSCRAW